MSKRFPSTSWAQALVEALAKSPAYASAGAGWTPGVIALTVAPAPSPETTGGTDAVTLELSAMGPSGGVATTLQEAVQQANLVLQASDDTWRALLSGVQDPVKALMSGQVKVAKGGLAAVVGQVFAYAALMETAAELGDA